MTNPLDVADVKWHIGVANTLKIVKGEWKRFFFTGNA
jgi:hypothetical protein